MRCLILMFMIFLSHLTFAQAKGLFGYNRIDFFNNRLDLHVPQDKEADERKIDPLTDEWAEPVISPSGKVSIYLPPKEVRDFLDNPEPESAKAYLKWNAGRIKKLILAQQLLNKEATSMNETKSLSGIDFSAVTLGSPLSNKLKGNYLFYFMLKGCPACAAQAKVIEEIYLNHPEIRIEAFAKGFSDEYLEKFKFPVRQDYGMSRLFDVDTYPSIAVFNKKGEKHLFKGYTAKEAVLELFR